MSWRGVKRGWNELRQSELSWKVFKKGFDELLHPPDAHLAPEEKQQRARRHELGFPLFLLNYPSRDERRQRQDAESVEQKHEDAG
jgi:hypothetical protein